MKNVCQTLADGKTSGQVRVGYTRNLPYVPYVIYYEYGNESRSYSNIFQCFLIFFQTYVIFNENSLISLYSQVSSASYYLHKSEVEYIFLVMIFTIGTRNRLQQP